MNLPRKRVALLIETSTTWGRGIIRGIAQYARQEAHWSLTLETRGKHETPTLPFNWQGDGVIGRLISHQIVDSIRKQAVPAVNVSQITIPDSPFPTVTTSETCVGEIAAAHLLERNFKSLGYYGPPHRQYYTDQILQAFSVEASLKKKPLSVFQPDRYLKTAQSSHDDLARLGPWLRKLEKPAGILAWNAVGAYRVISACELLEISVPKQVAVLAGENDELIESISEVSLSGIDHNPYEVGWHAAESLNNILMGEPTRHNARFIKPKGIRLGDSTARTTVSDTVVDQVITTIRDNPKKAVAVSEIARQAGLSRRALEVRFNKALGRSPGAEIRMIRLEYAQRLLTTTSIPIADVAEESGFSSINSFSRAFVSQFGISPRTYRNSAKESSS